jgi:chromosome segregation ATPase
MLVFAVLALSCMAVNVAYTIPPFIPIAIWRAWRAYVAAVSMVTATIVAYNVVKEDLGDVNEEIAAKESQKSSYEARQNELTMNLAQLRITKDRLGQAISQLRTALEGVSASDERHRDLASLELQLQNVNADLSLAESELNAVKGLLKAVIEALKPLYPKRDRLKAEATSKLTDLNNATQSKSNTYDAWEEAERVLRRLRNQQNNPDNGN